MKDVIEKGKLEAKPSLICFTEKVSDDNLISKEELQSQILCYMSDNVFETEIGKIIQPNVYPFYLMIQGDSVYAFLKADELDKIESLINGDQADGYEYSNKVKYVNEMLNLYDCIELGDSIQSCEVAYLDSLIRKENLFYGKFLLAKLYNQVNKDKAYELYHDLWANATTEEMRLFQNEYLEIMREKDRVIHVKKEDIMFDYTSYDFGRIKTNEEAECKFYFVNHSKINFMIYSITSTCGCTIPFWNKKPLRPGGRDSISVKVKVNDKSNIIKVITVKGNTDEVIKLQVKATVV